MMERTPETAPSTGETPTTAAGATTGGGGLHGRLRATEGYAAQAGLLRPLEGAPVQMMDDESTTKEVKPEKGGSEKEAPKGELEEKERRLGEEIAALRQQRSQILPQVETVILSHYERIKRSRPEAIALINQGTCQGCFRKIPPQLLNEVRRGETLHSCPSCSRLLYCEEVKIVKEASST